jgi:hypothetical protein
MHETKWKEKEDETIDAATASLWHTNRTAARRGALIGKRPAAAG